MTYLDTAHGQAMLNGYLKRFKGKESLKVYRSEIRQFFEFADIDDLIRLTGKTFTQYREHLGQNFKAQTVKRKFSILNQFFKYVEGKEKGFQSPIGKSYGDMQVFQGGVYSDSEAFQNLLTLWRSTLNRENTRKIYGGHVTLFFEWVQKAPKDLKQDDFTRFRDHLVTEKKQKPSTVWGKFIAVNGFLKFLAAKSRKFANPLKFAELKLTPPQKDKGYYSVLSEKEAQALFKQPDRRTLIGKRDYAILRLMLTYGLRVNEVSRLTYQDLEKDRVEGQQKVWIRDRKGRLGNRADTAIILNGKALWAFDEWLEGSRVRFKPETPLFLGFIWSSVDGGLVIHQARLRKGKHLSVKAIENMIARYVKKAGIDHGERVVSPHALRHTALTLLAKSGVELVDLKYIAGHQNVNTTMIYLHSVQSYKDHVGMHNPLNK